MCILPSSPCLPGCYITIRWLDSFLMVLHGTRRLLHFACLLLVYCHVWWKFSVLELSLNWCVCLVKVNSAYVFVHLQIGSAAEEPRVLCIVQDTTNAKTVNERLTLNLPASTTVNKLCEDVAHKAGYVNGTFCLAWANKSDMVRVLP